MNNERATKGIIIGVICGILYAVYPSLINLINTKNWGHDYLGLITFTMSSLGVIFIFSFFWNILFMGPKKYYLIVKRNWKNKCVWKITIINLLGTPFGMGFMAIGLSLSGGAVGKTFIALCIPITALLERVFLRRKFKRIAIFGMLLATLAAIGLGAFAIKPQNFNIEMFIGIIFCLFTAFVWGVQGMLMYKIIHESPTNLKASDLATLKYLLALIFHFVVVLPILSIINLSVQPTFGQMGKMFSSYRDVPILAISGFAIWFSYYLYTIITKTLGATMGIVFENISIIVVPLLVFLLYVIIKAIDPTDLSISSTVIKEDLEHIKTWWFWCFAILLLFGIGLSVVEPKSKIWKWYKKRQRNSKIKS